MAGPVVAGAVVLRPDRRIPGLDDSKRLLPDERARLFGEIRRHAIAFAVGIIDAATNTFSIAIQNDFDAIFTSCGSENNSCKENLAYRGRV